MDLNQIIGDGQMMSPAQLAPHDHDENLHMNLESLNYSHELTIYIPILDQPVQSLRTRRATHMRPWDLHSTPRGVDL